MIKSINVQSSFQNYEVLFLDKIEWKNFSDYIFFLDQKVKELYPVIKNEQVIYIDAVERNKSLSYIHDYVLPQIDKYKPNRDTKVLAIGGGVAQEITAFVASIYKRGIAWSFVPTTLLAQADSCLGGKNSLNFGDTKNLLGTIYPPREIFICSSFLKTLQSRDLRSGWGEIIKIHLLSGEKDFNYLYYQIKTGEIDFQSVTYNSLLLKKEVIEKDEFDQRGRLKLNLGHTFGHALEVATDYQIAHGEAVTLGLKLALEYSLHCNLVQSEGFFEKATDLIDWNLQGIKITKFDINKFSKALLNDKKNSEDYIRLVLNSGVGETCLYELSKEELRNLVQFSHKSLKRFID